MRLNNVEHGHTPRQKAFLEQAHAMRGKALPLPDIICLLLYRPELFGTPFSLATENTMHKPSDWSFGERELFAVPSPEDFARTARVPQTHSYAPPSIHLT